MSNSGMRKPHGVWVETPEFGAEVQHDTVQCPHCHKHWTWFDGMEKTLNRCFKCSAYVCPRCTFCVTQEQKMENAEAGKDLLYKPTRIGMR